MAGLPLAVAYLLLAARRSRFDSGSRAAAAWAYVGFCAAYGVFAALHRLWSTLHPERRGVLLANHTARSTCGSTIAGGSPPREFPRCWPAFPATRCSTCRSTRSGSRLPRMPAGQELRIVHLTDLHMSGRIAKEYFVEMRRRREPAGARPDPAHRRPGRTRQVPGLAARHARRTCARRRASSSCSAITICASTARSWLKTLSDLGLVHLGGTTS